jgi:gliding motility-associated-like protein
VIAAGSSGDVSVTTPGGTSVLAGFTILSSDANLASLSLSAGTLSPVFASGTTSYTATVPFASSSISLTPNRVEGTASIKVNGLTVTSGSASASIALAIGNNTINTVVTAGDGTTSKTYSIIITREGLGLSSNAELSAMSLSTGTLSPVFTSGTTSYTATVPFASSSLSITPTRAEGTASIKVNGLTVTSGSASASFALAIGNNTINTVVTAGDGTTSKTYSIIITRLAGSSNANLSAMSISSGTLSPTFVPTTSDYDAFVNTNVNSITINPRSDHNGAVIKVNGILVASQSNSGNIPLIIGSNAVNIVLTSEDGINQKTYTVKVTRLKPEQTLPDNVGNATSSDTAKEIVVNSPNLPLTITVPVGTTTSTTVVYGDLIAAGKGNVPQTSITTPLAKIEIPASTQISASGTSWNGSFLAPNVSSYDIPAKPGIVIKTGLIVEIGSVDFSLSFDKAIRIVLFGEAGKKVSRVHGNTYEEILLTGPDTQAAGDALPANSSFKLDVGNDLVIWTKGLSRFITFTETEDLDVALVNLDKTALTDELIKGANADLSSITTAISLPSIGSKGSVITWVSSNPSVISKDGKIINRPLFGSGDVTLTLTATLTKGLITETKTFTITVPQLANQAPVINAIANQTLCYSTVPQTIALSGINPGPETSQTTLLSLSSTNSTLLSGLSIVAGTDGKAELRFTPGNPSGGTATITVTVKDNGGTANGGVDTFIRTFTISINPLPILNISSNLGTSISKGLTAQLTASGGTSYTWSNAQGIISGQNSPILTVRPAATTTYTVVVSNGTACTNSQSITINVSDDYQALKGTNILTPNGDGKNDFLIIKNLDMYPKNTLRIFNKAGREIYTKLNYANDWDGSISGSYLMEDTYFYIVDFGQGLHKLKGFVSIVR